MTIKKQIAAEKANRARGGGLRSIGQGVFLGFGDEIEAGLRNPGLLFGNENSKREYAEDINNIRGSIDAYRDLNPKSALGLEMAGGLIPSLLPFMGATAAPRTLGLLSRMGRGAGVGAAEGGLYGMGTQEGGLLSRNPLNTEAGIGAGLGAIIPGIGATAGMAINRFRNPMTRSEKGFSTIIGDDEITAGEMLDARNFDKPQVAADLSGQNAQQRVGALSGMSGPQRNPINEALRARQVGQAERAIADIEQTTNIPLQNTNEQLAKLTGERAARARPLYEAAYEAGEVINDPAITRLINQPDFRTAWEKGKRIYDAENSTRMLENKPTLPELGDLPKDAVSFNLRGLDNVYRGMRAQADEAYRSGDAALGKALKEQANALRDRLDTLVPEYGKARAVFKSDSEMLEQMKLGQEFMNPGRMARSSRTLKKELEGLDEGQLEAYRLGAIDAVRQRIGFSAKEGTNIQSRFFGTKEMRDRLRLLYPDGTEGDKQFNDLMNRLAQEDQMQRTLNFAHGSRTTPMIQEVQQQLADEGALNISPTDIQRGLWATLGDKTAGAISRGFKGGSPSTRKGTADLLMDPVGVQASDIATRQPMPVLSPRMQQFQDNLTRANQQADQMRGLLNRFNNPAAATGGLLGSMYSNRQ